MAEPLLITFADAGYLPLLNIWLERLDRLGVKHRRVYGLDFTTVAWCQRRGIESLKLPWERGNLRDLWIRRIQVFRALLDAGEDFIHSDADAIWIRNPLLTGSAVGRDEDLVFSQGTVWPPEIHDRWGFVLCCGWFQARATPAARSFFAELESDVRVSGDDQISVNRLLLAAGAEWERPPEAGYRLPFRDRWICCWPQPNTAALPSTTLRVALLPHREFQRLPEDFGHAVIKHFLTPKNCDQKLVVLRQLGLLDE